MSGTESRVVYSWDTNVFLAYLNEEKDKPLADIAAVAREIELGKADFIVSTIVIAELLDLVDDESLASDFQEFIRRPNVEIVNVDPRIARRTARLRAEWRATATSDEQARNIKTPDAIIIASAMLAGATVLHSLEPRMRRHHKTALVDGLDITMPMLSGGQLVLRTVKAEKEGGEADVEEIAGTPIPSEPFAADPGTSPSGIAEHETAAQFDGRETGEIDIPEPATEAAEEQSADDLDGGS